MKIDLMNLHKLFINGRWVKPSSDKLLKVVNPANSKVIANVASANNEDVAFAIRSAREAFDNGSWRNYLPHERAEVLNGIADKIEQNKEELANLETLNNGKILKESLDDMEGAVRTFRYYAGLCGKPLGETFEADYPLNAKVVREPIGVCAQIIPWNYPLLMAAWKLAPALAAGNVCILKPSEVTPLTAIRLFELIEDIGLPNGVINLLVGTGANTGEPLAKSYLVDKIAFTGSVPTGKKIMMNSVGNLKKVSLELGGKSPNIIFADADFETAVDYALFGIFNNTGQVCSAGSRLLVEESIYQKTINELIKRTKKIRVGEGLDDSSQMGPVVNQSQLQKVLNYIDIGRKEGANLVVGGNRLTGAEYKNGYFIEPAIFTDIDPNMRIFKEEIFGPVLCVIPFKYEEEAIRLANDTSYGLAGAVFTSDGAKAERVAREVKAGTMWINTYEENLIEGPWGGYKQSGTGRELGVYGYLSYTEVKQIINNLEVKPTEWFE